MFKDALKSLRLQNKMTQEELSRKLNMSKSAISMYESGVREPNFETLETIADIFNVDINTLMDKKPSDKDELQEYLEELKNRSEMRMLFSVTKNATKEDVMQAVKIIEALKKE